jgi:hypothetical protein
MSHVDAFRWWNTSLDPFASPDSPPSCLSPTDATFLWKRFCPIFNLIAFPHLPPDRYWRTIRKILLSFCDSDSIPDPEQDFPDFVTILYRFRMVLRPRSITNCVSLLSDFRCLHFDRFVLYECPLFCSDPLLFFRGFLTFLDSSPPRFEGFVANPAIVDGFLWFYISFLRPVPCANTLAWRHHLILAEIFWKIVIAPGRSGECSVEWSLKYLDFLIHSVGSCPVEFEIAAVRWIVSLTQRLMGTVDRRQLKEKLKAALGRLPCRSVAFPYLFRFLVFDASRLIGSARLLQGTEICSVELIGFMEVFAAQFGPLSPIVKLVKSGLMNSILHRACFFTVRKLLLRYPEDEPVREWMTVCVRRLVIFVALATRQQKYRNKTVLVCESLCLFANMHLGWLRDAVFAAGAGILPSKYVPIYFTGFVRMTGEPDNETLAEFGSFVKQRYNLKTFPFDAGSLRLTPVAAIEPSGSTQPSLPVHQLPPLPKKGTHVSGPHRAPSRSKKSCVSVLRIFNFRLFR